MTNATTDPWAVWREARPPTRLVHLDSASAGRSSYAVLEAVGDHLLLEAQVGGYVAADQAAPALDRARADLGRLLGLGAGDLAFVESATAALDVLLDVWPLPAGSRVGVPPSAWGPNVELVRRRGHLPVPLPVDGVGVLTPDLLDGALTTDPPDLVLLDLVAAHRGLVQPARELAAVARRHGVPLWVDVAQGLGHVDADTGADAVVATSRKWLTGPRGVGLVGVASGHHDRLRVPARAKHPDTGPVALLESDEAHVAGRLGLGLAAAELLAVGPEAVAARLVEVGQEVRDRVAEVPGWRVVGPDAPAAAITSVAPTAGQDPARVRAGLLAAGVLTTLCLPWRAPGEVGEHDPGSLRVSPHVDVVGDDLDALVRGLVAAAG
ncbi:aminotransferase class V-fold PLP-dependent enzyme [Nocardioides aurantiacus]|uniref:Pyridoxal 5-phosphate dependent beta-lyase n=1 Tax=Nocardioides aurantiacus TaxID=86796 RepID=A0A3N2CV06_9ACTN|nr:aminotransferase class V-fold PLP-dependent enzyme [Nocardioides aurantiacus]ROR91382.1 pyridoxal 5-phosphate dependent beta-lyase [Nocardioides aurantiacus]